MPQRYIERRVKMVALAALAGAGSATAGVGIAHWAIADTSGFYMYPTQRTLTPGYARQQPIAEQFWDRQAADAVGGQASVVSTMTSAQPAYLSASGS